MQTRLQGCWAGACRGAKFGAIAGMVIWTVLTIIMLVTALAVPDIREHALADLEKDWNRFGSFWEPLRIVGGFLMPLALMAVYGVVGGVFVMGIAGFLRPSETPASAVVNDRANVID